VAGWLVFRVPFLYKSDTENHLNRLLMARARTVQSISLFAPNSEGQQALVRGANHTSESLNRGRAGALFRIEDSSLVDGRSREEILLRLNQERGGWLIHLKDCRIRGNRATVDVARAALQEVWGNRFQSKYSTIDQASLSPGWKSGPLASAKT
jgi:hypothetical protein